MKLVECVPNFSEGRDKGIIKLITNAISSVSGISLLDVDPGYDTNRTVVTFVGEPQAVVRAAFEGIKTASKVIDMRFHKGSHARMGATDVCPLIPISGITIEDCIALSKSLGERVGMELGIPVYLYEYAANQSDRQNLATIRQGEYEGLAEKLTNPQWKPDFGPVTFNAESGATVIGVRDFLIAYNINLNTQDHRLATDIAFELREKGRSKRIPDPHSPNLLDGEIVRGKDEKAIKVPGLFKDVKAVGWYLDSYKRAQISINFINYKSSTIHDVFDAACGLASERGIRVTGSELVGLIPKEALLMAGKHYLEKQRRTKGVPEEIIIETAIQSLGLNDVSAFNPQEKIIEYAVGKNERPLLSMPIQSFSDELSSNSPAPGGGSVSALVGSLGAALTSMVAALTHEKKVFNKIKPDMESIGEEAQLLKSRLEFLIDEDTHAFNRVITATRLKPGSAQEEREKRETVEVANQYATTIPFETAELSCQVIRLAEKIVKMGNPNSVSDGGVAAEVGLAGVRGAAMNVLINLSSVQDEDFSENKRKAIQALVEKAEKLHQNVYNHTLKTINES